MPNLFWAHIKVNSNTSAAIKSLVTIPLSFETVCPPCPRLGKKLLIGTRNFPTGTFYVLENLACQ